MLIYYNLKQTLFHLFFFILFVAALFLYKERLFYDSSFYFFKMVNSGGFHIEHGRVSLIISQLIPLIAYYMGASLKIIMIVASVGHVIVFYLVFYLLFYKLKDEAAAIVLILFLFVNQLWTFYTPMIEIGYGIVFTILFYSILKNGLYDTKIKYAFLILLAFLILTSHPENYLLFIFILLWDILDRGFSYKPHLPLIALIPLLFILKILNISNYEDGKLKHTYSALESLHKFDSTYLQNLLSTFLYHYLEVVLAFVMLLIYLLVKKEKYKFILLLSSFLIFIFLINLSADANQLQWYFEVMYKPLLPLVFIPFFYEIYTSSPLNIKKIIFSIVVLILSLRVIWTWSFGEEIRERTAQLERLVYTASFKEGNKFILHLNNFDHDYSHVSWSTPIETMLLSAMKGKENTLSIASMEDYLYEDNHEILKPNEYMFRKFDIIPHSQLNSRFFELEEGNYKNLNAAEFEYPKSQIKDFVQLELLEKDLLFERGSTAFLLTRITNLSQYPLPSNYDSNIRLSYHLYNNQHENIQWDGIRTPIEMDIDTYHDQHIKVEIPDAAGVYYIQLDIVIEGEFWVGFEKKYKIMVI